ncbi:MAG: sulfatase [Pirellulales bacterium]|nr:sulfatase [Pirellulales bacterium]
MIARAFISAVALGWMVAAATASRGAEPAATASSPARKPNVVVILADDLGYADLGIQGCRDIPTPNLDKLAASGVRCTNGYVSGPYCSPTRAGLLTGRYQQRFGHEFNPGGEGRADAKAGLPLSQVTIADRLRAAGYRTGLVGKWHLGAAPEFQPPRRGFDEFFGFLGGAHSYFPPQGAPILRGTEAVDEHEYLTDAIAREAVAFVERHKTDPFFLYVAFNAVHTPMHATDERLQRFAAIEDSQRRTYAAMLVAMDEAVGRVLDSVHAAKLTEQTLVFFCSDNGGPTMIGTTRNGSSNAPLRGSKRTTLEGGVRVPFVVSWPGRLPAGKVYDKSVIQLDFLPTALAAAGLTASVPQEQALDGVDLLPFLTGKNDSAPHAVLYWRLGDQMAIRRGDWKLVRYDRVADGGTAGVTTARLYNLAEDIGESRDLSADKPELASELQTAWESWSAQLAEPLWGAGRARQGARERARRD